MKERAIPIVPVTDLGRSMEFYGRLGFVALDAWPPDYAVLARGRFVIHLARRVLDAAFERSAFYLLVADVGAIRAEWMRAGLTFHEPTERPWGGIEFMFRDPDGNLVRVSNSGYTAD